MSAPAEEEKKEVQAPSDAPDGSARPDEGTGDTPAVAETGGEVVEAKESEAGKGASGDKPADPVASFGKGAPGGLGGGAMMGGMQASTDASAATSTERAIKLFIGQVPKTMPDSEVR